MNKIARVREKLAAGGLCFGTHCSTTDADFYEMCGLLGYDYVWIDNEHAGMTQPMIKNAVIATNAGGCCAFVRVPDHQMAHIKPVLEVRPDGLLCKDPDGKEVLIPGETVICAVGQRANRTDVDALRRSAPFVREVGDCIRPANITKAMYEGYHAALDI